MDQRCSIKDRLNTTTQINGWTVEGDRYVDPINKEKLPIYIKVNIFLTFMSFENNRPIVDELR